MTQPAADTLAAPPIEAAPLLRVLLEAAGLGLLDQLARRDHLRRPFWPPYAGHDAVHGLAPLAAAVVRLWCVGDRVPAAELVDALDDETLGELEVAGLVTREDGMLASPWRVVTFMQRHLLATPPAHDARFDARAPVAYVGPESCFLGPIVLGAERCARALDLGTGAGLLAALAPADEVVAVERDPFAAAVSRFNVALGGRRHIEVREGDLFEPVAGERFDLVTCNPPFLPAPAGITLPACGDGGPDGDDTLREVLAGVTGRLTAGGRALVYGEDFGGSDEPYVAAWLRERWPSGWDATLHVTHTRFNERTALRLTALWEAAGATRDAAWCAWNELQARRPSTHHHSFIVDIAPGIGRVDVRRPPRV